MRTSDTSSQNMNANDRGGDYRHIRHALTAAVQGRVSRAASETLIERRALGSGVSGLRPSSGPGLSPP